MSSVLRIGLPAFLLTIPAIASAVTFPSRPAKTDFFSDEAGLLDDAAKKRINDICFALWHDKRLPIYVVTIPSLTAHQSSGRPIESYAYELFNHWGIGKQERNFGMLLLVSPGDRKARIELGGGWGRRYDGLADQVMREQIVPRFKEGRFAGGIVAGTEGMDAMARGLDLPSPYMPPWQVALWIAAIILCILVGISLIASGRTGWGWAFLLGAGALLVLLLRAMASAKAGSGSSSGGFGGGSSGGGGATGSW